MRNLGLIAIAAMLGFAGVYAVKQSDASGGQLFATSNCLIKGNVSIGSGERIYHVPGQHYYDDTIIRLDFGERWFCSEAEARAAGWRRAGY